ncbi:Undecaprenyl-diphosphatase [Aurantiacibacter atlanticus]|uniref:Undecaprenyl-diphosphatase n=1 Tax=Aurantiacibacter atlanticus TaxID=1648404 RepID=A0A0H4VJG8_9SPHN|nr:undecaprenyl-diphosphate phosphatase [Aurantiacibacter atlanticus]AKQ43036.1 Undecaprenyl-diphosphatase [Aurantiacibacter atlanticus]MDF1834237.1 undecaprenyl-diphosphate phosphatase [Alteraurantiacibacter sp. bin_em_oilr2.035]
MTFLQLLLIAVVQGITEFLPISSSGHLILIPHLTNFPDQGPMIDVAVHVGSLLAIIIYFWRDVLGLAKGGFASIGIGKEPEQKRLFWWVVVGTIPAVAVGLFLKLGGYLESFRITDLVAVNLIVYGLLLGAADRWGKQTKSYEDVTWRDALLVGLAQAMALIPGTSRSGSTMTMARILGYKRVEAARFSFLLAIPAVAGAGLLAALDLAEASAQMQTDALIAGALTFVAAFLTMAFLMNFLKKASMLVFVVYRVAMGIALLAFF